MTEYTYPGLVHPSQAEPVTPRLQLVDVLEPLVPDGVRVLGFARDLDAPGTAGTVMVRVDEVVPSSQPQAVREYRVALVLVVAQTTTGEDDLDDLLETVLALLEETKTGIVWTAARRATFEEKFPAYEIDTTVHFNTKEQ